MTETAVRCPQCGKTYQVLDSQLGRKASCRACRQTFVLGSPEQATEAPPPDKVTDTQPTPSAQQSTVNRPVRPPRVKRPAGGSGPSVAKPPIPPTTQKTDKPPVATTSVREDEDRFEILEQLGAGAFGTVYKARDKRIDRLVALKIPKFGSLVSEQDTQRFLREARAAGNLQHPHIVPIYDAGQYGGSYFIASRFIEGQTLEQVSAKPTQLSCRQGALIVEKLASALASVHAAGVVHRDVKPANVMIDTNGEPLLMDFGMAKRDEGDVLKTQEGMHIGTPAYMSPEQHAGQSHLADARSDQWALGVMLYELLTGRRPFQAPNAIQMAYTVRETEVESPRKLCRSVDRDLETICLKCLQKRPADRYPSCASLANELQRWSQGKPIHARPKGVIEPSWRWFQRNSIWVGVSSLVVVLLVVFAGLFLASRSPDAEFCLESIQDQRVLVNQEFQVRARMTDPKAWEDQVKFVLTEGATLGAQLHVDSGTVNFSSPSTGSYRFGIRAVNMNDSNQSDEVSFQVTVLEPVPAPILAPIEQQTGAPGEEICLSAEVLNRSDLPCDLRFELIGTVPTGAMIDAASGELTWNLSPDQQVARYPLTIRAVADWPGEPSATTTFAVQVQTSEAPEDTGIVEVIVEEPEPVEPPPKPPTPPKPHVVWKVGEAAIRRELAQPTTFEFVERPLTDVMNWISERHGVAIVVDRRALDDIGIGADTPITKQINDVPLGEALRGILNELDLTYKLENDVLLVTTREEASHSIQTKIYKILRPQLYMRGNSLDMQKLLSDIERRVTPRSWVSAGGIGSMSPLVLPRAFALIVTQTNDAHEEIARQYVNDLLPMSLPSQPVTKPPLDGRSTPQVALEQETEVSFVDAPLSEVVEQLSARHKVSIQLDRQGLADVGIPADAPMTIELRGIPLGSALRLMLRDLELTYVVDNVAITITTPEKTEGRLTTVSYPVRDLVINGNANPLIDAIKSSVTPVGWQETGGQGTIRILSAQWSLEIRISPQDHEQIVAFLATVCAANR